MSQRKFRRARRKGAAAKEERGAAKGGGAVRQPSVQAMVWYREEHWPALKEMFSDGDLLPKTYADWLRRAEEMRQRVQAEGDAVIKVYIDPETFPEWCREKGLEMNAEARSQLAIEVAQAQSFSL